MKKWILIASILWCSQLGFAQTILDQKIDFSAQQLSIAEALNALGAETGIAIAFSNQFFDEESSINKTWQQQSIRLILQQILQGTGIAYREVGDQLILFRRAEPKEIPTHTISGFIEAAESGERLLMATIYCSQHQKGTLSNEYGFYSLTLPQGKTTLSVSYLGAEGINQTLDLKADQVMNIALKSSVSLTEIVVSAKESYDNGQISDPPTRLAIEQIELMPDLGGEPDVLRMAQTLPGIQSGADGLGGLYVRGGNADQNLMLLDGVPVYNATHLLGLFSIYNASAIRSARLWKGAFPARYGGRLSSIFDVRTREGNTKKWSGEAQLGLLSGKATIEGPFANERGAILLTARRTHSDFLLGSINRKVFYQDYPEDVVTNFYDFNAKVNFTFSPKDRLYLSYYQGRDQFGLESEEFEEGKDITFDNEIFWGNTIASLRWNHLFSNRLFSNITLTHSQYDFSNAVLEQEISIDGVSNEEDNFFFYQLFSDIQDQAINADFDFHPHPDHYIRFGAGFTLHRFRPGAVFLEEEEGEEFDFGDVDEVAELYDPPELNTYETHLYLEDEIQWSTRWRMNLGMRLSAFGEENRTYVFPEPRLSSQFRINEQWEVKASWNRMIQYLHRINATGLSTPDDVWVPSTDTLRPQEAWQADLGLSFLGKSGWQVEMTAYFKRMKHLLTFPQNRSFLSFDEDLETVLESGTGRSYGLELLFKREFGKTGGWLNYTLAWSRRKFEALNEGERYPFQFDRRHQINLYWFYQINDRFHLGANWTYGSANPLLLVSEDSFNEDVFPDQFAEPGEKNEKRSQVYHRLDLGANYRWSGKRLSHHLKLSIYNVYNQSNPAFHRLEFDDEINDLETEAVHLLPILPSFAYRLSF